MEGGNRVEVLFEEIRREVGVIAEGHGVLLRELQETRADLQGRMDDGFADIRFHF